MKTILMEFDMSLIHQLRKKIKKMTFMKFKIINQKRDNQNKWKNQKKKNNNNNNTNNKQKHKKGITKSIKE